MIFTGTRSSAHVKSMSKTHLDDMCRALHKTKLKGRELEEIEKMKMTDGFDAGKDTGNPFYIYLS